MTDENITTLLHANLDSLELRAESEKSVCKEILGTNQSAYTEAVFEYCLDREIEKWPTNAIKAISGLDPTNLLIYYEEKLEALRKLLLLIIQKYFQFYSVKYLSHRIVLLILKLQKTRIFFFNCDVFCVFQSLYVLICKCQN
jgi:hypothetical protein